MSSIRTIVASSLMIFTMFFLVFINKGENIYPNKPLSTFPKDIGDWKGSENHFDQKVYDRLGVDDSFLCTYNNHKDPPIELYIGFYQSQREGDLIHSPRHCLPGAGWQFISSRKSLINCPSKSNWQRIEVNNILLQKGSDKEIMFYWFQGRGRFLTSEYMQKIYMVIDSITRRRTDEAFVRLMVPVIDDNEEKASEYLHKFTQILIPVLQEYIPS